MSPSCGWIMRRAVVLVLVAQSLAVMQAGGARPRSNSAEAEAAVGSSGTDFGGFFVFSAAAGCVEGNSLTADRSCSCLNETFPDIGFVHPGDPARATVLCYGQKPGEAFHGAFMRLNGSCSTPNMFTGDCTCPSLQSRPQFYTPFAGYPDAVVTICYGLSANAFFGGFSVLVSSVSCQGNLFAVNKTCGCSSSYRAQSIFSSTAATLCGASCHEMASAAQCEQLGEVCSWCPGTKLLLDGRTQDEEVGTCYSSVPTGLLCCTGGTVVNCPTPAPPPPSCPCCGFCFGPGAFCCQNWDADGSSFCCSPAMCGNGTSPSCGPADYEGPCMCQ